MTFEHVVACSMYEGVFDSIHICFINAEINSIENFVDYVLVLWILESYKLLPLFYTFFLTIFFGSRYRGRRNLSYSDLKCQWTVLLHFMDAIEILLLMELGNFFLVLRIKICFEFIIKCSFQQILVLVINLKQIIKIVIDVSKGFGSTNRTLYANLSFCFVEFENFGAALVEHVFHAVDAHTMFTSCLR